MQNRTRKSQPALLAEEPEIKNSPYRKGNWTVTMLKEELRGRQLPITGKKSELIDRLENSPVKAGPAPNTKNQPVSPIKFEKRESTPKKSVDSQASEGSPLKSVIANFVASSRGRSRSRSASPLAQEHGIMTRSRSTSLSRGTLLTWNRQPGAVLKNFFLASAEGFRKNFFFFAALFGIVAGIASLLHFNSGYKTIFLDQLSRAQPVLETFVDGVVSNLGFKRSEFTKYVTKASRFMYDCASGNIERNLSSGRLRCSASPLKRFDAGLPGRLFWLTREQFLAYTSGAAFSSVLTFLAARKAHTALPLATNQISRKILTNSRRFVFILAALAPFEAAALVAGFSGFEGQKFAQLLALRTFVAVPLNFVSKMLFAKNQKVFTAQFALLPTNFTSFFTQSAKFFNESSQILKARQFFNAFLYVVIIAAAVQVIANNYVYHKNRVTRKSS